MNQPSRRQNSAGNSVRIPKLEIPPFRDVWLFLAVSWVCLRLVIVIFLIMPTFYIDGENFKWTEFWDTF